MDVYSIGVAVALIISISLFSVGFPPLSVLIVGLFSVVPTLYLLHFH